MQHCNIALLPAISAQCCSVLQYVWLLFEVYCSVTNVAILQYCPRILHSAVVPCNMCHIDLDCVTVWCSASVCAVRYSVLQCVLQCVAARLAWCRGDSRDNARFRFAAQRLLQKPIFVWTHTLQVKKKFNRERRKINKRDKEYAAIRVS